MEKTIQDLTFKNEALKQEIKDFNNDLDGIIYKQLEWFLILELNYILFRNL
jgi:hypothetical protein